MHEETYTRNGCTVTIGVHDCWDESPRDWCNLGVMQCAHRRYKLGDESVDLDALARLGAKGYARWLSLFHDAAIVLPLGLIDHSGLSMYVGSGAHWCDPGGWDSGQVGIIYTTRAKVREEYGDAPDALRRAEDALRAEVDVYDRYLRGEVYYFAVDDEVGEQVGSCGGIYGLNECRAEADAAADAVAPVIEPEPMIDARAMLPEGE